MSEEEFKKYLNTTINLRSFTGVGRFRSIGRAIRRGHVSLYGTIAPNRPFHNRKNTSKRRGVHSIAFNEEKKRLYGSLTGKKVY